MTFLVSFILPLSYFFLDLWTSFINRENKVNGPGERTNMGLTMWTGCLWKWTWPGYNTHFSVGLCWPSQLMLQLSSTVEFATPWTQLMNVSRINRRRQIALFHSIISNQSLKWSNIFSLTHWTTSGQAQHVIHKLSRPPKQLIFKLSWLRNPSDRISFFVQLFNESMLSKIRILLHLSNSTCR